MAHRHLVFHTLTHSLCVRVCVRVCACIPGRILGELVPPACPLLGEGSQGRGWGLQQHSGGCTHTHTDACEYTDTHTRRKRTATRARTHTSTFNPDTSPHRKHTSEATQGHVSAPPPAEQHRQAARHKSKDSSPLPQPVAIKRQQVGLQYLPSRSPASLQTAELGRPGYFYTLVLFASDSRRWHISSPL